MHRLARYENATEIFPVIYLQARIPGTRDICQLLADEPGTGLHIEILLHFSHQRLDGSQVRPQRGNKTAPDDAGTETNPMPKDRRVRSLRCSSICRPTLSGAKRSSVFNHWM
jgi:hypothetical protein